MKSKQGYRVLPFSVNRRMAAASAAVCRERDTIHTITEVDITEPRRLILEHRERTGERLSLPAYVVASLARTVTEFPEVNAFRAGGRLIVLDDVTIGTLIERALGGEVVPELTGIPAADKLTFRQIHDQIRTAEQQSEEQLGALSGITWVVRLIPSALFKTFIRLAARNVRMAQRYGVIAVTAVGMFGPSPMWLVPLSASTVAVAVGSSREPSRRLAERDARPPGIRPLYPSFTATERSARAKASAVSFTGSAATASLTVVLPLWTSSTRAASPPQAFSTASTGPWS